MDRRRRPHVRLLSLVALGALLASIVAPATASAASFSIQLDLKAQGLSSLTQVTNAGDGTDRLFLVERRGTIRVYENGAVKPGYFFDFRERVEDGGERGLLGLAFHPDFETNRLLFVYFTRNGGDIVVARFQTNSARTAVIKSTYAPLMLIEHSRYTNHNGGAMAFGPNGYLYIGTGDGGGSGDPSNNAQNKSSPLGKILRINVNGTGSGSFGRYSIPKTNPFYGSKPGLGIVWSYGLRNPWRISFDRANFRLFTGDVGQNKWEEINREPIQSTGGRNFGWRIMEGRHCYNRSSCSLKGDWLPFAEYYHKDGNCSITGGYVYRGPTQTKLFGLYVFADFCSGRIFTIPGDGVNDDRRTRADTSQMITSFGEDEAGELYAVTIDGRLYQVLAP